MSNISISWHMLIRGNLNETLQAINSLQGLYDNMVIALDSREDSDEVYEALKHYSNTTVYRQVFDDFKRYDLARQDCLDRVPQDSIFTGWSDSDEILISNPIEIRKWLFETNPEAVNCAINYLHSVGGHEAGKIYRNGRIRIWRNGTRRWSRRCHEYAAPINGIENYVEGDIIFNHIKQDNSSYRSEHHIKLMQEDIDEGNTAWKFFQAKEYKIQNDIDMAIIKYFEYLQSGDINYIEDALTQLSELCLSLKQYEKLLDMLFELNIPSPIANEYAAICFFYLGNLETAIEFHEKAKELNVNNYQFITNNNKFFTKET